MKYFRLIVLGLFFFSSQSFAKSSHWSGGSGSGNEQGNGGFVLDCEEVAHNFCSDIQFYDSYEAEKRYSLQPKFDHGIDWLSCADPQWAFYKEEKCLRYSLAVANALLQRLKPQDNNLYNVLQEHLNSFSKEVKFLPKIIIFPTEDMGIGFIPPDRILKQLVVQHEPIVDEDPRYIVSRDLWVKMNPDQQAVAILHEVIYRQAILNRPVESSQLVRYFNALIISGKIAELPSQKYWEINKKTFR